MLLGHLQLEDHSKLYGMILYRQGGYRIRCCTGGTQWFGMMTWAMGNDVLVFFSETVL